MVQLVHPVQLAYVGLFTLAAAVCFGVVGRARARIEHRDTEWGLVALLATNGLWAGCHVAQLLVPTPTAKVAVYVLGLASGLATVGAWLYFCSAYAGESYHRNPWLRWTAVGFYLAVLAVKVTSPIHGLYFSTETATEPFVRLVIHLGVAHWIVTGIAYALSAVGFYVLFDRFSDSPHATTRLRLLVALAGLPVALDLFGYLAPGVLLTMNYEPIGVAAFAVGVLYVADGSFVAVRRFGREQVFDEVGEGILILDADGVVRDANAAARRLFPALEGGIGAPFEAVVPALAEGPPEDRLAVVELDREDGTRYVLVSSRTVTPGETPLVRTVTLTDVTRIERQRREIDRRREQMDDVAAAITHELRNALTVVEGRLEFVERELGSGTDPSVRESLATADETAREMTRIVSDLAMLARYGGGVDETVRVNLEAVVSSARASSDGGNEWGRKPTGTETDGERTDATVGDLGAVTADPARAELLFGYLFRFLRAVAADDVTVRRDGDRLLVEATTPALADADPERLFEYGVAVPDADSGMFLPLVRTLAEAHGWTVTAETDGSEFRVVVAW